MRARASSVAASAAAMLVAAEVLRPSGTQSLVAESAVSSAATDWPVYSGSYSGERYSPLTQLTTANVARLRQLCTYDTQERVSFQTGPVVAGGTMYFTTDTMTHAIDAASCAPKWKQSTGQQPTYLKVDRSAWRRTTSHRIDLLIG